MRKWVIMLPLMAALAGCGDPLAGVERVSQIQDMPTENAAAALPSQAELDRDTPIFAGLFRRSAPQGDQIEVPVTDTGEDGPGDVSEPAEDIAEAVAAVPDVQEFEAEVAQDPEPQRAQGVLGWLRRVAGPAAVAASLAVADRAAQTGTAETARLQIPAPQPDGAALETANVPLATPQRKGLRAVLSPRASGPEGLELRDVPMGARVPFGQVARVCDARGRKLGKLVQQAARKGANYKLYDTEPDSAAPRTFYVTGFTDHCPRQFTAALAMFGTPEMHEQLRYGLPASEYPYSSTDRAYEKVKSQVCKVGRSKPCGTRVTRLAQTTAFVSAYERFTENGRWADVLLHDGVVLAAALKTPP